MPGSTYYIYIYIFPIHYRSYKSNLEQIRNAVLETVYIGVLEAYLRCKTVSQVWSSKYGTTASASRVRTAMAQVCASDNYTDRLLR